MEISHVQYLLVLLVSLFFLPAFHAIDFEYCNQSGYDLGNITRVEVSTVPIKIDDEPTITITVYGSTHSASKSIEEGSVEVTIYDGRLLNIYNDICSLNACPIKPDTNFLLTLTEVVYSRGFWYDQEKYVVTLFGDKRIELMCVAFNAPNYTARTLVST